MTRAATGSRGHIGLILTLAALTGVAPMATDMYVPGLPELTRSLHASPTAVQLSMTGFLVGVVAGQLVLGPISDAVGRRRVLLAGAAAFAICSAACASAPTAELLNAARVGQGIAGAAGLVVSRAVITDLFGAVAAARKFSALAAITSAAPILAPMIGGAVLSVASWRMVFAVLTVLGLAQVAAVAVWVPESLAPSQRAASRPLAILRSMRQLLRRRALVCYAISLCFGGAAVYVYVAGSSFVFEGAYGFSSSSTSIVYGVNALGTMAGSALAGWLVTRIGTARLLVTGIGASLAAACSLVVLTVATGGSSVVTWACLFAMITAFGLYFPAVTAAAQELGRDAPGATSALLGGGQFLLGGAAAPLVGLFGTGGVLPMAVLTALCLTAATLSALAGRRSGPVT
ncbi:multidrug effflux MFS transporter [Nocardia mexicana]|uniref:DHA1 family bicyclomycin/chloramphenicol resistance-like MFS transporter n=1 Tax=Nocardia mexicana TaxID=279262 RepID=A0A370H3H5_9NOCA|nr:multidrug effflux MFS transporter [Nocardia mexicana]RDI50108.1 DHA1 family bicyclomycin/chloramphenicol resistance-like MFS transporter [Nocardia mexicana]